MCSDNSNHAMIYLWFICGMCLLMLTFENVGERIASIFPCNARKTTHNVLEWCIVGDSLLSNPLRAIAKLLGFVSNLSPPSGLLLTGHNNFHRDEHYQFTSLLCEIYAESRGRVQVLHHLFPPSPITKARGVSAESFGLLDVSCARRWLTCLDMSWNGRKLWSDVRILVLIMSSKDIGNSKGSTG